MKNMIKIKLLFFVSLSIIFILIFFDYKYNYIYFHPSTYKFNYINELSMPIKKVNACVLVLLRNKNLIQFAKTMKQFEYVYNQKHNYPYVLLNDEEFSSEFKASIVKYTNSKVEFGLIPRYQWSIPDWIDKSKLKIGLDNIRFTINYHHMCRYFSGFFFRHDLTLKYEYFWRIDYDSNFPCSIESDPFETLLSKNKSYGFVLLDGEASYTMPTLWMTIKEFLAKKENKKIIPSNNLINFVSSDNLETLKSYCIFYNNFEIGAFSLFRRKSYIDFFEFLDKDGGFYYERWGDAPVHTYWVLLNLNKFQIHFFKDIAYSHQHGANYKLDVNDNKKCNILIDNCNSEWLDFTI